MKRIYAFTMVAFLWIGLVPVLTAATKIEIEIEDFAFIPKSVTINQGDTVEWKNRDNVGHTSTSGESGVPNGLWDSGTLSTDQRFSRVFDSAGTFAYYCKPHPYMTGSIIVQEKPDTTDTLPAVIIENKDVPLPLFNIESGEVKFTVLEPGPVDLVIYDAAGRRKELIVREYLTSGTYNMPVKQLDRGVYFVKLVSGEYVAVRKIVQL